MDSIKVTDYADYGTGHVMAEFTEQEKVNIRINYDNAKQHPTISTTPQEWDRLVAWVEWQRKDKEIKKEES